MPSPVELSLSSLLPTLSPLPAELVQLSNSLLAQSRARASSLKPEEEIGRTYACCHIACERLGKRLALELGRPSPPCPPKVYQKLKTYLGSVLRTPVTPSRGKGGRTEDKLQESAAGTPASERSVRTATSAATTPTGRGLRAKPAQSIEQSTPTKQKLDGGSAAGRKRKAGDDPAEAQLQLEAAQAGTEPEALQEEEQVVRSAKKPAKTPLRRQEKHAKRPTALSSHDPDDVGPAGLQAGLGTMFQSAVDWLSEERREDYAVWKQEILKECEEMERRMQATGVEAMG